MSKRFSIGLVVLAAVAFGGWALMDSSEALGAASNGASLNGLDACDGGGSGCAAKNEPCGANSDCCSGICNRNGRCRKGGPPGGGCCDPGLEPGVGGNPFCFEGHTCCSSGNWQCNNPDGSPSCDPGEVCVDCAGAGGSCTSNDDCCSGRCKGNGTCR